MCSLQCFLMLRSEQSIELDLLVYLEMHLPLVIVVYKSFDRAFRLLHELDQVVLLVARLLCLEEFVEVLFVVTLLAHATLHLATLLFAR